MSNDEQMAEIGRLVTDAAESSKNEILLKSKLENYAKRFSHLSAAINGELQLGPTYQELTKALAEGIPTEQEVRETVVEWRNERARSIELESRKKALGI